MRLARPRCAIDAFPSVGWKKERSHGILRYTLPDSDKGILLKSFINDYLNERHSQELD